MPPALVAKAQLDRLHAAMVDAVAEHGYPDTTVDHLVALAGVSKTTFYQHFDNKRECYLATFEEIVDRLSQSVTAAYQAEGDLRERLIAGLAVFMRLAVEEPAVASLVVVDSLMLGPDGFERRERLSRRFEQLLEQSLVGSSTDVPRAVELASRAVVGGVRSVASRRLRAGRQDELPGLVEELVDWALAYEQPDGELTGNAVEAARQPAPSPPPPEDDALPGWDEPPDSPLSRHTLTQRQRLVRAAAVIAYKRGYAALSIPSITSTAGVSNQTFYAHFEHKREPLLEAFDALAEEAVAVTATAIAAAGGGPEGLGYGLKAMLEYLAASEMFTRIALLELPVAGPDALDRGDAVLAAFESFIAPQGPIGALGEAAPEPVREAIGSGIWALLVYECYHGRSAQMAELAPDIARLAIAPLEVAAAG